MRALKYVSLSGIFLSAALSAVAFSTAADAATYSVVVPKPNFTHRNNLGQQLTQVEVSQRLPDGSWNLHSTLAIYDGDKKIAEYTSPNLTLDRPEGFSDTGVVGTRYFYRSAGTGYEFVTAHGFVYADGVFKDVSAGSSGTSQAHGINNLKQAVGVVGNSAFRYENGTMTSIALLFGLSNAFGINNLGQATGWVIQEGLWFAFLYTPASASSPATMVNIGYLDPSHAYSTGSGINDLGQIIGESAVGNYNDKHAFVYRTGTMTDLGTFGGSSSSPSSINNLGAIVGSSQLADGRQHAFVYNDGKMTDLNSLIDPTDPRAGTEFATATRVNDDGVITVSTALSTSAPRYLLVPRAESGIDSAYYNFEATTQGWASNGEPIIDVATSTARKFAGKKSLGIKINNAGFASVAVPTPPVSAGKTLTFHIYLPADARIDWIQPYAQQGQAGGWNWHGNWKPIAALQRGAWNTLTVEVPADAQPLNRVGLELYMSEPYSGTVHVDSVSF